MADTPQRAYRAACPACGAPVEFRSAQSTHAVCSFCRSTIVRSGDTLARVGKVAEVFEDYSPLQLMASGQMEGQAFTIVGRLQYKGESGTWTEWNAVFDDGSYALLAEDNGAYVFSRPTGPHEGPGTRELPDAASLRVGAATIIDGKRYTVGSNDQVALVSAQGELPKLPPLNQAFAMIELRSADGEVLSIDYGSQPPAVTAGRATSIEALRMTGLREPAAKEEKARQFSCPNCGAPVEVTLASTKSITCRSCNSIIDLADGVGGELRHAVQDEPIQPVIPLGSTGLLQGAQWQVVGFQHRMGHEPGDEDESFGWSEYLLYNRTRGFTFLVDSEEGWSIVKPTTGAPVMSPNGKTATYLGTTYQLKYAYEAETNYVAGEFYWPVQRGQKSFNRDFAHGASLLSMEQTPREVTWSAGTTVGSDAVASAFKLKDKSDLLKRGDSGPTLPGGSGMGIGCGTIILMFIIILILLLVIKACVGDTGSGYVSSGRSSGGSYGGYSSGGGHK